MKKVYIVVFTALFSACAIRFFRLNSIYPSYTEHVSYMDDTITINELEISDVEFEKTSSSEFWEKNDVYAKNNNDITYILKFKIQNNTQRLKSINLSRLLIEYNGWSSCFDLDKMFLLNSSLESYCLSLSSGDEISVSIPYTYRGKDNLDDKFGGKDFCKINYYMSYPDKYVIIMRNKMKDGAC